MTSKRWLGSLLLASSLLLGLAAYFMYSNGLPGTPKLESDIRFPVGSLLLSDEPARLRGLCKILLEEVEPNCGAK